MNCISGSGARSLSSVLPGEHRWALFLALIVITACGVEPSESADSPAKREYGAHYSLRIDPAAAAVDVALEIRQSEHLLREIRFPALSRQIEGWGGDGKWQIDGEGLRWLVPRDGGTLRWRVKVNHQREQNSYDAWLGTEWGIFRTEDLIPRARTRALKGSTSSTSFSFELPTGWSVVTEYSSKQNPIRVERADRRFDQPTGWIVAGRLGVRRDTIAGIRVTVAGPEGQAVRRLDMLALLNWTLPELAELLPQPPERLTIVSAGDPMWRGGLSAPASLYIHAERPMISENATSTLLHEVLHTALSFRVREGFDWITEGFAEFYSIELLRRGHAITARRHARAIADQADWAKRARRLCSKHSTGATTALAVTKMVALNQEILDKTSGESNLDDLLQKVLESRAPVDLDALSTFAGDLTGEASDTLHIDNLPGCSRMASGNQGS